MPVGRSGKLYSPAVVTVIVRVSPVAALSKRTEALGIAAPLVSVTEPLRLPRNVCEYAIEPSIAKRAQVLRDITLLVIYMGRDVKNPAQTLQCFSKDASKS